MATPIQDVTSIPASTPTENALIQGVINGLFVNFDAIIHLLSSDEHWALLREEGAEALSSLNRVIAADQLAAVLATLLTSATFDSHAANETTDVKHLTDVLLSALNTRGTSDALSGTNTIVGADQLIAAISAAAANYATTAQGLKADTAVQPAALESKADLVGGFIPSSQIPGSYDDVLEFADLASLPETGETGKIYVTLDTNLAYRWSGTTYIAIGNDLALGETVSTAYRGDRGKIAYDHSQITGNPHGGTPADFGAATAAQGALAATAVQPVALAAETAARIAADQEMSGNRQLVWCRDFHGGYAYLPAAAERTGRGLYGLTDIYRILVAGTGIGVLVDAAPLKVELTDPLDNASRFKVSIELDSGTLVLQTTERVIPHVAWRSAGISVDSPISGSISSASVHAWVGGAEYTIANSGLEVVGTSYEGAPVASTGAWSLCADSAGTNQLTCRVASDGWRALNYPLTSAQWADWMATGRLPYEGAGIMQAIENGGFESAGSGGSDVFSAWTEAVTGTSTVTQDTSDYSPNGGEASLKLDYPSGEFAQVTQFSKLTIGRAYEIHFDAKSSTGAQSLAIAGDGGAVIYATVMPSAAWETRSVSVIASTEDIIFKRSGGSGTLWVDNIRVLSLGDLLAGLDLSAQPMCSFAGTSILWDSETGVAMIGPQKEDIHVATSTPLYVSGLFEGSRIVIPTDRVVDKVWITNEGTAAATVELRATSGSGTIITTSTSIPATGTPYPVTVAAAGASAGVNSGCKVYANISGTDPAIIRMRMRLTSR